jgi:hypothetical protein
LPDFNAGQTYLIDAFRSARRRAYLSAVSSGRRLVSFRHVRLTAYNLNAGMLQFYSFVYNNLPYSPYPFLLYQIKKRAKKEDKPDIRPGVTFSTGKYPC